MKIAILISALYKYYYYYYSVDSGISIKPTAIPRMSIFYSCNNILVIFPFSVYWLVWMFIPVYEYDQGNIKLLLSL